MSCLVYCCGHSIIEVAERCSFGSKCRFNEKGPTSDRLLCGLLVEKSGLGACKCTLLCVSLALRPSFRYKETSNGRESPELQCTMPESNGQLSVTSTHENDHKSRAIAYISRQLCMGIEGPDERAGQCRPLILVTFC